MKHLQKIWVRILISLLGASILQESIHFKTGKDEFNPGAIWIIAGIIYLILRLMFWLYNWNQSKKME